MDRQCLLPPPPHLTVSPPPSSNPSRFLCRMKKEEDSLTIFGVAEQDQGSYTCVASTELDQDLAKAYLTVLGNRHCMPFRCPHPASLHPEKWAWLGGQCPRSASQPGMRILLSEGLKVRKLLLSEQAVLDAFLTS